MRPKTSPRSLVDIHMRPKSNGKAAADDPDSVALATRQRAPTSSMYSLLERAGVLETRYLVSDDLTSLNLLPGRATRREILLHRLAHGPFHRTFVKTAEVPAGHVQEFEDGRGNFFLLGQGLHRFNSRYARLGGCHSLRSTKLLVHGDITLVLVPEGSAGYATDRGQPVVLPPGLHYIRSETLKFERVVPLDASVVRLGPLTLVCGNEGKTAVTQDSGRLVCLPGGRAHLLDHAQWFFEKFVSTKIQSKRLGGTSGTTADNVHVRVEAAVDWRVDDVALAALQKSIRRDTNTSTGKDMGLLADDVGQAVGAALSVLVSGLNYSDTFRTDGRPRGALLTPQLEEECRRRATEHTAKFGVSVTALSVLNCLPTDTKLTASLAQGAVAAARALQAATEARGRAQALRIEAEGEAAAAAIRAKSHAESEVARAAGSRKAAEMLAESAVATELAKIKETGVALKGCKSSMFFGSEASNVGRLLIDSN